MAATAVTSANAASPVRAAAGALTTGRRGGRPLTVDADSDPGRWAASPTQPGSSPANTSLAQTGVYAGGCIGPRGLDAVAAGAGYAVAMVGAAVLMLVGSQRLSSSGPR